MIPTGSWSVLLMTRDIPKLATATGRQTGPQQMVPEHTFIARTHRTVQLWSAVFVEPDIRFR
jgi:hypothetical protein